MTLTYELIALLALYGLLEATFALGRWSLRDDLTELTREHERERRAWLLAEPQTQQTQYERNQGVGIQAVSVYGSALHLEMQNSTSQMELAYRQLSNLQNLTGYLAQQRYKDPK